MIHTHWRLSSFRFLRASISARPRHFGHSFCLKPPCIGTCPDPSQSGQLLVLREGTHLSCFERQLTDVSMHEHKTLVSDEKPYSKRRSLTSPSFDPDHGPRFRIRTGRASNASDPSAQTTWSSTSVRECQVLYRIA